MKHQDKLTTVRANYTYSYDAAQQLGVQYLDGVATCYGYDSADRLIGDGTTYGYDAAGNRNNSGFIPTFSNQLQKDSLGNTYTYDAEGNEIKKTFSGGNWTYQYDTANHLTTVQHYTGQRWIWR
jgi:YD repeat-containing protein